jgi:two-component system, cell cycle response regulator
MHSENAAASQATLQGDADAIPIAPSQASHSCRVLVVDDDDLVRERLAALLSASHFDVEVAASGAEAMRVLNSTRCHIVLTDWLMPDMDGLTLCRTVRSREQDPYIYVLMLTIRDTRRDMLTGLAAGADDYVVKGAPIEEILARLEVGRRIVRANDSLNQHLSSRHTDAATGAHNLRYLVQHLPRELARSQRHGHALAVLTCSIDGLADAESAVPAGDELLRTFVERSVGSIRKGDWLARTSRDEFMIVLPETSAVGARCVARKLRCLFVSSPLCVAEDSSALTVRIGMTAVEAKHDPDSALRIGALLRAATDRSNADRLLQEGASTVDTSSYVSDNHPAAPGKHGIH